MNDVGPGRASTHEERWLHEVNAAAEIFFRRELLQATTLWPPAFLRERGVDEVMEPGSIWHVGYAPEGGTRLMDHLLKDGFGRETLMRAGLVSWTDDGRVVDRYQDLLMLVSTDRRLNPVGFVGIDRDGNTRTLTPDTLVHRPSEAVVGVLEQIDLLRAGATAVIVDHPLDAIGLELAARGSGASKYAGIPLLGLGVSDSQVETLRRYSLTDQVIVTVPDDFVASARAVATGVNLTSAFDHIRLIERPSGPFRTNPGRLRVLADFIVAESASGVRSGLDGHEHYAPAPETPGPSL